MAKGKVTYESRIEKAKERIKKKPQNALREIGKILVKEIKAITPVKTGNLRKSVGSWFRKKEGDLQIGFKAWYAHLVIFGTKENKREDFFTAKVLEKKDDIQGLIQDALKELEKDD